MLNLLTQLTNLETLLTNLMASLAPVSNVQPSSSKITSHPPCIVASNIKPQTQFSMTHCQSKAKTSKAKRKSTKALIGSMINKQLERIRGQTTMFRIW